MKTSTCRSESGDSRQHTNTNTNSYLQTLALPFVPEAHDAVVGGATGDHVIPIRLEAVEGAVMRLLPLPHTLPVWEQQTNQRASGLYASQCLKEQHAGGHP